MVKTTAELVTTVIVARNAAPTIARAVTSALNAGARRILLVDDHSTDGTAALAQAEAGRLLRTVRPIRHVSVGNARQTALEALETPFGIWLDADDELLPGRIEHMLDALGEGGADLVFDPVVLIDGATGDALYELGLPPFLRLRGGVWRSFERNWIPMLAGGFRTEFARRMGYDRAFSHAEDYDFLLRSIIAGAAVALLDQPRYRYYHYPDSLSRDLSQAQRHVRRVQQRFETPLLSDRLAASGLSDGQCRFILAARAMVLEEHAALSRYCMAMRGCSEIIEPYERSTDWCGRFLQASSWLLCGRSAGALPLLEDLDAECESRDVRNNLGVAYWLEGQHQRALRLFTSLHEEYPDYLDARNNWRLLSASPANGRAETPLTAPSITRQPLRLTPGRHAYGLLQPPSGRG